MLKYLKKNLGENIMGDINIELTKDQPWIAKWCFCTELRPYIEQIMWHTINLWWLFK